MGANEEQISVLVKNGVDSFSYGLIHASIAFFIFLYFHLQIDLYWRSGKNEGEPQYNTAMDNSRNMTHIPLPLSDPRTSSTISRDDDDDDDLNKGGSNVMLEVKDNMGNEDHMSLLRE